MHFQSIDLQFNSHQKKNQRFNRFKLKSLNSPGIPGVVFTAKEIHK